MLTKYYKEIKEEFKKRRKNITGFNKKFLELWEKAYKTQDFQDIRKTQLWIENSGAYCTLQEILYKYIQKKGE